MHTGGEKGALYSDKTPLFDTPLLHFPIRCEFHSFMSFFMPWVMDCLNFVMVCLNFATDCLNLNNIICENDILYRRPCSTILCRLIDSAQILSIFLPLIVVLEFEIAAWVKQN